METKPTTEQIKVKFIGLGYNTGDKIKFYKTFDCPIFEDKTNNITLGGVTHDAPISKLEQQDEWLSGLDKKDIIIEHNLMSIINFEIIEKNTAKVPKISNKQKFMHLAEMVITKPQMKLDFLATYQRLGDTLKGLDFKKQFMITLRTLNIGYDAQIEVYKRTISILKEEDEEFNQKLYKTLWDKGLRRRLEKNEDGTFTKNSNEFKSTNLLDEL